MTLHVDNRVVHFETYIEAVGTIRLTSSLDVIIFNFLLSAPKNLINNS